MCRDQVEIWSLCIQQQSGWTKQISLAPQGHMQDLLKETQTTWQLGDKNTS